MKARIKKTGEIVNLASYAAITLDMCDSWGNPIEMKPEEIELIQDKTNDFDWQSFCNQAAKDILCAFATRLETNETPDVFDPNFYSPIAVEWADSLIKALKEKEEK